MQQRFGEDGLSPNFGRIMPWLDKVRLRGNFQILDDVQRYNTLTLNNFPSLE